MVTAIRDQWAIILGVVIIVAAIVWLAVRRR
jgi:LPXTG-motif cell wall-anchored protein